MCVAHKVSGASGASPVSLLRLVIMLNAVYIDRKPLSTNTAEDQREAE